MPVYDYLCGSCGRFEQRRPIAESKELAACPDCHILAPRVLTAPQLNLMSNANRIAETRNEKSAHAPEVVHRAESPTAHAHDDHSGGKPSHKHKPHKPSRPWMLGH